jgi:hypothetical protein
MDRREHHRVQLRLPARLRWTTPLGQKTEVCHTVNASRGGLLVPSDGSHAAGVPVWVTFPYDPQLTARQPEVLARVARLGALEPQVSTPSNDDTARAPAATVGVSFDVEPRPVVPASSPASARDSRDREPDRRHSVRRRIALPVHVRPENIPWFEEAMTLDVSSRGVRFLSSRDHRPGQRVFVSFDPAASPHWLASLWGAVKEACFVIIRVEPVPQTAVLDVTICRIR